jgi:hypothetical protein
MSNKNIKDSFKYLKGEWKKLAQNEKFMEFKVYAFDFIFTSVCFGLVIFLLNVRNSFAKGIGFAILFALMQGYIKWFAEVVKEVKRSK